MFDAFSIPFTSLGDDCTLAHLHSLSLSLPLPSLTPACYAMRTAAGVYQEWQTRILHYHYTKQAAGNPCTEMGGFSRVLSSVNAKPDRLMDLMPTFVAASTDYQTHRGFHVINRPWSMVQLVNSPRYFLTIPA